MIKMTLQKEIQKYAETCQCTYEQAEIRVKIYKEIKKETEKTRLCPDCNTYSLSIEYPEAENVSYPNWVECQNEEIDCEFRSEVTKQYEPLEVWYDFDEVLAFAAWQLKEHGKEEVERQIGQTWDSFLEEKNADLIRSDGWRIGKGKKHDK